jgi:hypothetical protein
MGDGDEMRWTRAADECRGARGCCAFPCVALCASFLGAKERSKRKAIFGSRAQGSCGVLPSLFLCGTKMKSSLFFGFFWLLTLWL